MFQGISDGANRRLARFAPERSVILRSGDSTRYFSVSPVTQICAAALLAGLAGWGAFTSFSLLDTSLRASAAEERLAISEAAWRERIERAEKRAQAAEAELASAREARRVSVDHLASQHEALSAAIAAQRENAAALTEEQNRLALLSGEHDETLRLCEATELRAAEMETALRAKTQEAEGRGAMLALLSNKLGDVASARDSVAEDRGALYLQIDELSAEINERAARQDLILDKLESAAEASLAPLEKVFRDTDLNLGPVLDAVKREAGGSGGPFIPFQETGILAENPEQAERLDALMTQLERVNLMRLAIERIPLGRPAAGVRMTSSYGYRKDPFNKRGARHTGVDYAGRRGAPILATADGVVSFAGRQRGYGKIVQIRHDFGFETYYGHLNKIRVKKGQRVNRGDRIGDLGSTGRSTGNHVHYEIRSGGNPVNPAKYVEAAKNVF